MPLNALRTVSPGGAKAAAARADATAPASKAAPFVCSCWLCSYRGLVAALLVVVALLAVVAHHRGRA